MASQDLEDLIHRNPQLRFEAREQKLVEGMIGLLFDEDPMVQSRAIQCVPVFSKPLTNASLLSLLDRLLQVIVSPPARTPQNRDIAAQSLINVLVVLEESKGADVAPALLPQTCNILKRNKASDPLLELLGVLDALLSKFGGAMAKEWAQVQEILLRGITQSGATSVSGRQYPLVKLSITCLGNLCKYTPDELFEANVQELLTAAAAASHAFSLRILIQALGSICRSVGRRLGPYISKLLPLIVGTIRDARFEDDFELKDNCFKTLTSLVTEATRDVAPFLHEQLVPLGLEFIEYDPNFVPLDAHEAPAPVEDDEGWGDGDDGWGGAEQDDDQVNSDVDPDDMSWQVRKASASLLTAIIASSPQTLGQLFGDVVPLIIKRFDERDEHVRLEVFAAFLEVVNRTAADLQQRLRDSCPTLARKLADIIKNPKATLVIRTQAISILSALAGVAPDMFAQDQVEIIMAEAVPLVDSKDSPPALKIALLDLIRKVLNRCPGSSFANHFRGLSAAVRGIIKSKKHSKQAVPQALRVTLQILHAHAPAPTQAASPASSSAPVQCPSYLRNFASPLQKKLEASDVDIDVKELAIECTGTLLSLYGPSVSRNYQELVNLLIERLKSELARAAALKAIEQMAASTFTEVPFTTENILAAIDLITEFLRKNSRPLRLGALKALPLLLKKGDACDAISSDVLLRLVTESSRLIDVQDLQVCHFALQLASLALSVKVSRTVAAKVCDVIYPKALGLVNSSLVQGQALHSLIELFEGLVKQNFKTFDEVHLSMLSAASKIPAEAVRKQSLSVLSLCVAAIANVAHPDQLRSTVDGFLASLKSPASNDVLVALLCLGEIGRTHDLSTYASLFSLIMGFFDSSQDEHRHAAATALGTVCLGSLGQFLPRLLQLLQTTEASRYLLFQALRELLAAQKSLPADAIAALLRFADYLHQNCNIKDEGLRSLVADCMGRLAALDPRPSLQRLLTGIASEHALVRATVVTSLKSFLAESPESPAMEQLIKESIVAVWKVCDDPDITPRRFAILSVTYAAHRRPNLVRPHLDMLQPIIYKHTALDPSLIRKQVFGPYTSEVDDGIPHRKCAFECMSILLDHFPQSLDFSAFIQALENGLKDDTSDIRMLSHMILSRLATLSAAIPFLLSVLPSLLRSLRDTIQKSSQEGDIRTEQDRNEELVRSALKAVAAIHRIGTATASIPAMRELLTLLRHPPLADHFLSILHGVSTTNDPVSQGPSSSGLH